MDIPESMRAELGAWNGGDGIDLESWTSCTGNFSLAVGYATLYWPEFVAFDGYILRRGFREESLRGFEAQPGATRRSVEWVMNHLHLGDLHGDVGDLTRDKLDALGRVLREIYAAKLAWQFPDAPCTVELVVPPEDDEVFDYQLSFWQTKHG